MKILYAIITIIFLCILGGGLYLSETNYLGLIPGVFGLIGVIYFGSKLDNKK